MGMYDTIKFEYPLPEGAPTGDYQTKDLDCVLNSYVVTEKGELVLQRHLGGLGLERYEDFTLRHNYTGDMGLIGGGDPPFVQLKATFEEGWLKSVEVIEESSDGA